MPHLSTQHNLLPEQAELITKICKTFRQGEFFQSYLVIGMGYLTTAIFIKELVKNILCEVACGVCKNCKLIETMQHPDFKYVTNVDSNIIKIDNVRDLQSTAYKSLSISKYKIVVIHPADKLNIQASSALLKILEEPPDNTIFILVAENIMTMPITIISRCHKYFMVDKSLISSNYFGLAKNYTENEERFILVANIDKFLNKILGLKVNQTNVCEIATDFKDFKLENVLWFLYLLTAEILKTKLGNKPVENSNLLNIFAKTQDLVSLFKQLDKISEGLKAIVANITLNNTLCIANILLGYK